MPLKQKKYPGVPELDIHTIDREPFTVGDIPVIPILVWHLRMPVLGFRFGKFTYITDANRIDEQEKEKIRGVGSAGCKCAPAAGAYFSLQSC